MASDVVSIVRSVPCDGLGVLTESEHPAKNKHSHTIKPSFTVYNILIGNHPPFIYQYSIYLTVLQYMFVYIKSKNLPKRDYYSILKDDDENGAPAARAQ